MVERTGTNKKNKTVPNAENEMNATAYIKFTLFAIMILMAQTAAWGQSVYYVNTTSGSNNSADDPSVAHIDWDRPFVSVYKKHLFFL